MFDISNTPVTINDSEVCMVVRHSSKILEQITDIEDLIEKIEHYFEEHEEKEETEVEEDLGEFLENWEAEHTSQLQKED